MLFRSIENCRKINDLVKLLSFPLDAGARWMPDAAIGLLERERAARNDQGVMLLRQAIGPNFEAFMRRQEGIVRENLTCLYQQANTSGRAGVKLARAYCANSSSTGAWCEPKTNPAARLPGVPAL